MSALPSHASATPAALPPGRLTWRHRVRAARARARRIEVGPGVALGRDVTLEGRVVIGERAVLGDGCRLLARGGEIRLGPGSVMGERCVLIAHAGITVGRSCLIGERAVIVDFEHSHDDVERPVRLQEVKAAEVSVGDGARIGHEAALTPGARVPAGAAVAAHAVVSRG